MKPTEFPVSEQVAPRRLYRGRLFRKYFLLILALVCGTLIVSGGVGLYFAYQENKLALASLQREKAGAAAARIEEFVRQVEQQLAFAALPQLGAEGVDQRLLEFHKVLRIAQAVTDIAYIDAKGRERLAVSRLAMNVVGSGKDRSQEPAFKGAKPGQTWFGPVYFRKDTEPYMIIAVRSGDTGPVTVAEVNLKFIWDVVTRIKIGQKGKAYVVDGAGYLIADPDIGLVLRKTDLSGLEQVRSALAPDADDSLALLAKDLAGNSVLTAYAPIEPAREQRAPGGGALGWKVFVEQPVSEVFAALDATILRTVLLLVAGLLFSALAAMWLARSMVRPISTLQEGAARIGAGELDQRIEVRTGDELETLADQFNEMSAQLRESYAGLEKKVEERTQELQQTLEQQTATAEILKVIAGSPSDEQPVFEAIIANAGKIAGGCSVNVTRLVGDHLHLAAYSKVSPDADALLKSSYPVAARTVGPLAEAVRRKTAFSVNDFEADPDVSPKARQVMRARGFRSTLYVPIVRGDVVYGVMHVSKVEPGPFPQRWIGMLRIFADQAVIAIENVRLFNETKESLEQQTAISEILRVISSSPADVEPVLQAVTERAARICEAKYADIMLAESGQLRVGASVGEGIGRPNPGELLPLNRDTVMGRSIVDKAPVHVADLQTDEEFKLGRQLAHKHGHRTILAVPLVRDGGALGTILLRRPEVRPFEEKHIALLKTFADQAAIAIENVRLFNQTKEALEQQTATSDILEVTSRSPTDVKPVFDTILANTMRLCEGNTAVLWSYDGKRLRVTAHNNMTEKAIRHLAENPLEPGDWNPTAQAALERRTVHVLDVFAEPRYRPLVPTGTTNTRPNAGTVLAVPLLRDHELLGVITVWRYEKKLFSEKQLAMVNTFAAQAVIAIENVRLFNETKEALEQQTATAEILKVISSSTTDTQPVFDAIVQSGLKLFPSATVVVTLPKDNQVTLAAVAGLAPDRAEKWVSRFPFPLSREYMHGLATLDRRLIDVPDAAASTDPSIETGIKNFLAGGYRAATIMPMIRGDAAIGTISVTRVEPGSLTEKQVALLRTFADQAVIAIENVRLFNETKEALEQQTATAEVLNVISGSITDASPVFDAISRGVLKLYGARNVALFVREGDRVNRVGHAVASADADDRSRELYPMPLDEKSLAGRCILRGEFIHIEDAQNEPGLSAQSRAVSKATGSRSVLMAPMQSRGVTTGALSVSRRLSGRFSDREVELLRSFADQAVIAMENVRLFREIQEKSAQLEIANKHKSDFLANMSHELRTPLNAIIGFSEVLIERMFGEVNAKQADYLKDIHESGKHLLSLINDILDLSKIEAGRMDLEIAAFDLPSALSNAMTLVRERAQRHGIALGLEVDKRLGELRADERKFKQIVLNLLSNAVKFTPDGGRVDVSAKLDTDKVEIAVKDTGIGIAPQDHGAVFEEFKQVGRDYMRKAEGTGLGLALTKRFVELHGGGIRLESAPGKGSTFTITLPLVH